MDRRLLILVSIIYICHVTVIHFVQKHFETESAKLL